MKTSAAHPCRASRDTSVVQPSCAQYRQMKLNVRRQLATHFQDAMPVALIRRAVDEAEQLALATDFPHLFFPELAQEQVRRISAAVGDRPYLAEAHFSAVSAA